MTLYPVRNVGCLPLFVWNLGGRDVCRSSGPVSVVSRIDRKGVHWVDETIALNELRGARPKTIVPPYFCELRQRASE